MNITIDGETHEVNKVYEHGSLPMLELDNGHEYYIAESAELAGEKAREYWEDLAQDDTKEFVCMVGQETLVSWALGQYAGPGSTQVKSLNEWLDLWLDTPEEHWASYDGEEKEARGPSYELLDRLGLDYDHENPWVAYRHN